MVILIPKYTSESVMCISQEYQVKVKVHLWKSYHMLYTNTLKYNKTVVGILIAIECYSVVIGI